jgi:hypothetical protein
MRRSDQHRSGPPPLAVLAVLFLLLVSAYYWFGTAKESTPIEGETVVEKPALGVGKPSGEELGHNTRDDATCDRLSGPSSGSCPVPRCMRPPNGCQHVLRYKAMSGGRCCPEPCRSEDAAGKVC